MSRWPSEKHFGSWLGLAPCPRQTGGKVQSAATRPGVNRAAQALRLAARNLQRSQSAKRHPVDVEAKLASARAMLGTSRRTR